MSLRDTDDQQAVTFSARRDCSLFERPWLQRVLADVPPGGAVLDLGCGAGAPIGVYLVERGFDVTGVDFAPAMLTLYAVTVPTARTIEADMRALALGARFDAIIGWGSFFHLKQGEQRAALPRIAGAPRAGGADVVDRRTRGGRGMGRCRGGTGVPRVAVAGGICRPFGGGGTPVEAFVPEDSECNGHTLLLARRSFERVDSVDNPEVAW